MKASLYIRCSTGKQDIAIQRKILSDYCNTHAIGVYKEFIDKGFSGRNIQRPAFTRLMEDAQSKLFDTVIVLKLDRLGRSNRHLSETLGRLRDIGIEFISIKDSVDTSTAGGRAFLNMLMVFAEFEVDLIRERIMLGLEKARRKGKHIGRLPLRIKFPEKYKQIKTLRNNGLSYRKICQRTDLSLSTVHYIYKRL